MKTAEQIAAGSQHPRELLKAIGELATAIAPHMTEGYKRERVAYALHVLVDHILALPTSRAILKEQADAR